MKNSIAHGNQKLLHFQTRKILSFSYETIDATHALSTAPIAYQQECLSKIENHFIICLLTLIKFRDRLSYQM